MGVVFPLFLRWCWCGCLSATEGDSARGITCLSICIPKGKYPKNWRLNLRTKLGWSDVLVNPDSIAAEDIYPVMNATISLNTSVTRFLEPLWKRSKKKQGKFNRRFRLLVDLIRLVNIRIAQYVQQLLKLPTKKFSLSKNMAIQPQRQFRLLWSEAIQM